MTGQSRDGWEKYLDPDEQLLCLDTPVDEFQFTPRSIGLSFIGLIFFGFAGFWTIDGTTPLFSGLTPDMPAGFNWFFVLFPLFGLPCVAAGPTKVFGQYLWDARLCRHVRCAISKRRAIMTSRFGRRNERSLPTGAETIVGFRPEGEACLYFAIEVTRDGEGGRVHERIGFEHFPDGDSAYSAIRLGQSGEAT